MTPMPPTPHTFDDSFVVTVERLALVEQPKRRVSGQLWLRIGGRPFPQEHWFDSVVVVLGWWASAVVDLRQGRHAVDFLFMEGPFEVSLTAGQAPGRVGVDAWRRTARNREHLFAGVAALSAIEGAVLEAGLEVEQFCRAVGFESRDLSTLSERLAALDQRTYLR